MPSTDGAIGIALQLHHHAVDHMSQDAACIEAHVADCRNPVARFWVVGDLAYARSLLFLLRSAGRASCHASSQACAYRGSSRPCHEASACDRCAVCAHSATPFALVRHPTICGCPSDTALVSTVKVHYGSITVNHFDCSNLSMKNEHAIRANPCCVGGKRCARPFVSRRAKRHSPHA